MNRIVLVVARAANGVIGNRGRIPWRLPEDIRRFKQLTLGKPCIMGRKTWESLPKRPLPGRANIVVTRDTAYRAEGALVAASLDEAIDRAAREAPGEIAIIGGAQIYVEALARADRIYLTRVHETVEGDTFFPVLDDAQWHMSMLQPAKASTSGLSFDVVQLDRRESAA